MAQRILELRDEGMELNDMAVLYRAHFHSMDLQMELTARGIPFRITSGLRFFEQAHIKDVAAFLRVAVNPRDEVAFTRLARMLPGVGNRTAESLWSRWLNATAGGRPSSHEELFATFKVPAKAAADWKQLSYTLDELVLKDGLAKPGDAIRSVMDGIYDEWMKAKFTNYEARRQDLEQLRAFSASHGSLEDFLGELALLTGVDVADGGKEEDETESVTLSSVHQAKGLEWRAVFLIWLTDGMFPNARAIGDRRRCRHGRGTALVLCRRDQGEGHAAPVLSAVVAGEFPGRCAPASLAVPGGIAAGIDGNMGSRRGVGGSGPGRGDSQLGACGARRAG